VQVPAVAVVRADPAHLAVGVVEDDVLALAVALDHRAFPTGENGTAPVALRFEVPRARVLAEPHGPPSVVEHHRSVLPGALLDGQEDVAQGGIVRLRDHHRRGWAQIGAGMEGPHTHPSGA
jgi:hypothetical protein